MFIGHYGPAFVIKSIRPAIPIWLLFIAVQIVDVAWAVLVLLGIEKVRIVPGITASNPLDLYYMPYTHSLAAAVLWAVSSKLPLQAAAWSADMARCSLDRTCGVLALDTRLAGA